MVKPYLDVSVSDSISSRVLTAFEHETNLILAGFEQS